MRKRILELLLFSSLFVLGCNQAENQQPSANSTVAGENSTASPANEFQEFLKYFEKLGLPVEVFHHSILNPDPIPKDLYMKFLGFQEERDVHAFGNIPIAKDHIALVAAHEPFENVVYYELYIFDQAGKLISSLQIAGMDEDWLGMCVFEDNGKIRLEARTPDMDEDESEPLTTLLYKVGDNGEIEVLEM